MTNSQITAILKKVKPVSFNDLEKIFNLTHLGSGCFRAAYQIETSNIVIKFPIEKYAIRHSKREIRAIVKVQKRRSFRHLKRYVPKIYYMDYENGVIASGLLNNVEKVDWEQVKIVNSLFSDTLGKPCLDIAYSNVGRDGRGQIKILDMGCF